MAVGTGTSLALSSLLSLLLFAGMQMYSRQLASTEWLTIQGGLLGSALFVCSLTASLGTGSGTGGQKRGWRGVGPEHRVRGLETEPKGWWGAGPGAGSGSRGWEQGRGMGVGGREQVQRPGVGLEQRGWEMGGQQDPVLSLNPTTRPSTTWRTSSSGRASRPRYSPRVSAVGAQEGSGNTSVSKGLWKGWGCSSSETGWSQPCPGTVAAPLELLLGLGEMMLLLQPRPPPSPGAALQHRVSPGSPQSSPASCWPCSPLASSTGSV
uniref:Dolichyl-diphosphooligosaccharide--protein glycosyltransferase subunit KCP2 n=1 Tax=Corvus moneduloides TaxID=1196302 RepID=A0A8U7P0R3_CORMO